MQGLLPRQVLMDPVVRLTADDLLTKAGLAREGAVQGDHQPRLMHEGLTFNCVFSGCRQPPPPVPLGFSPFRFPDRKRHFASKRPLPKRGAYRSLSWNQRPYFWASRRM